MCTAGVATTRVETEKNSLYKNVDIGPSDRVVPFVVECTGKLGRAGREFLKDIGMEFEDIKALLGDIASTMAFANGECIALTSMYGPDEARGPA